MDVGSRMQCLEVGIRVSVIRVPVSAIFLGSEFRVQCWVFLSGLGLRFGIRYARKNAYATHMGGCQNYGPFLGP